jgi:hypothetical protein
MNRKLVECTRGAAQKAMDLDCRALSSESGGSNVGAIARRMPAGSQSALLPETK